MAGFSFWIAGSSAILDTVLANEGGLWEEGEEWLSWSHWLTSMISKGVYSILILLITVCVIVTTVKKKLGFGESGVPGDMLEDTVANDVTGWMGSICSSSVGGHHPLVMASTDEAHLTFRKIFYNNGDFQGTEETLRIKDQLKEAHDAVVLLRDELESTSKNKLELEEALSVVDKSKTEAEDLLLTSRYHGALEVEQLKRDNAQTRRQLQEILLERDELAQEREVLQREARIVASALRDNQAMDAKLEEARREIAKLKEQLEVVKEEREAAARIVDKIVSSNGHFPPTELPDIQTAISASLAQDLGSNMRNEDREMASRFFAEVNKTKEAMEKDDEKLILDDDDDDDEVGDLVGRHPSSLSEELEVERTTSHGDFLCFDSSESRISVFNEDIVSLDEDKVWANECDEDDYPASQSVITGSAAFRKFLESQQKLTDDEVD